MRSFFRGFRRGVRAFGQNIAMIVNAALLLAVYLVGVGITSIIAKLSGKRFLDMKIAEEKTYWSDLHLSKKPAEEYYRQF